MFFALYVLFRLWINVKSPMLIFNKSDKELCYTFYNSDAVTILRNVLCYMATAFKSHELNIKFVTPT